MTDRPSAPGANIRVGLLSPSAAVRAGVRALLGADERLEVVLEAAALVDLPPVLESQVDILVLTPTALRGLDYQREIQHGTQIGVLWLTDEEPGNHFEPPHLPGQPWGVLPLDVESEGLTIAVRALYEGLTVAPPDWLEQRYTDIGSVKSTNHGDGEGLTAREVEVLQQLALGLTNKQIALVLGISEHTVKFHISSIYGKLAVMNRAEAVRVGVRQGWISI